jgi:site-specific recombinase XerD
MSIRVVLTDERYELVDDDGAIVVEANEFLAALRVRGLSPRTVRAYAYDLALLYRWLRAGNNELEQLTAADLMAFIGHQRKADAQPRSINRRLSTCRLLYRFCTGKEIGRGPGASFPAPHYKGPGRDRCLGLHRLRGRARKLRVKEPRKLVEPLSPGQVRCFVRSLRRYRDLAIVYLMLLCGLRSREVLGLKLADVVFDEGRLRVLGKGERERMLPLSDMIAQVLRDYIRLERPRRCGAQLFVVLQGRTRSQPMTTAGLRSLFRHRRRALGLAAANAHRFRHTFGADMARAGVRLPILQKMMGHADSKTTLQYIQLSMADIAEQYRHAIAEIEKRYGGS